MGCAELNGIDPRRPGLAGIDWRADLPMAWRLHVITPLTTDCHKEYEMHAIRCLGHDEGGALCFYAHDYAIPGLRSDDDETFYTVVDFGERLRAWRLRDGRWLCFRLNLRHEDPDRTPGVYTVGENPLGQDPWRLIRWIALR